MVVQLICKKKKTKKKNKNQKQTNKNKTKQTNKIAPPPKKKTHKKPPNYIAINSNANFKTFRHNQFFIQAQIEAISSTKNAKKSVPDFCICVNRLLILPFSFMFSPLLKKI